MKLAEFLKEYIENEVGIVVPEDSIQAGIEAFVKAEPRMIYVCGPKGLVETFK